MRQNPNKITTDRYKNPLLFVLVGAIGMSPLVIVSSGADLDLAELGRKTASEQHVHLDSGHFTDHLADPRSIRAVGYDSGKSSDRRPGGRDNWDVYNERFAA
jgi:hypothetical protein